MSTSESVIIQKWRRQLPGSQTWTDGEHSYVSGHEMISFNHYPLDTSSDDGGPWMLHKIQDRPVFGSFSPVKSTNSYQGEVGISPPSTWNRLVPSKTSDSELNSFGTSAIAKTAPTNPAFDLSTSLGELASDGLPAVLGSSLFKERTRLARSAGSEYLNVEFGWKPLLRDIRSFARTVKDSEKILHQYRKGSDTKIRRGYMGPAATRTRSLEASNFAMIPSLEFGVGRISEISERQQWFRGAFRYHIPTDDTTLGKFRQWASLSDHLLGWKVTPETVWNIAPWSWATDWFANTGDIMTNISNLGRDGLVLQYGYSMARHEVQTEMSARFELGYNSRVYATASRSIHEVWKQRRQATPYGFGINLSSLSAKQVAIIAALGLSKT